MRSAVFFPRRNQVAPIGDPASVGARGDDDKHNDAHRACAWGDARRKKIGQDDVMSETDDPGELPDNLVRVQFGQGKKRAQPEPPPPGEKLETFQRLIERGMVMVTLDSRRTGVRVPAKFAGDMQLALNFSLRFGVADFMYDTRGVRATLTFGGQPTFCDVPWTSVYAMRSHVDNQALLWPEDLPSELLEMIPDAKAVLEQRKLEREKREAEGKPNPAKATEVATPTEAPKAVEPPHDLEPHKSTATQAPSDAPTDNDDPPEPPKRPGLRLIRN